MTRPFALSLFLVFSLFASGSAPAADIGLRFHHAHEVRDLLAEPLTSYPQSHEKVTVVQFPVEQYPEQAKEVRNCFPKSKITEEMILANVPQDATKEANFNGLIKRIKAGEAAGFEWGDILVYREPLFDALCPGQNLLPGPWKDRRLISERDVDALRSRLRQAHAAGEIAQENYRICGLIYSWLNIDEKEKAFIRSKLDGVYIELNSRNGKWMKEGVRTSIGDDFKNPGHDFAAFGLPGTKDTAQMAAWCVKEKKRFGITSGANLPDIWYRDMFADYLLRAQEAGFDPASEQCTYLLHHNRGADDKMLAYFPESGTSTMTALTKYLLDKVATPAH